MDKVRKDNKLTRAKSYQFGIQHRRGGSTGGLFGNYNYNVMNSSDQQFWVAVLPTLLTTEVVAVAGSLIICIVVLRHITIGHNRL